MPAGSTKSPGNRAPLATSTVSRPRSSVPFRVLHRTAQSRIEWRNHLIWQCCRDRPARRSALRSVRYAGIGCMSAKIQVFRRIGGANVKARPLCTRSTAAAGRQGTPENRVPASHFSTGARSSSRLDGQRRSRVPPILQRYAHRLAPLRKGIEQRPYVGAELRGGLRQGEV